MKYQPTLRSTGLLLTLLLTACGGTAPVAAPVQHGDVLISDAGERAGINRYTAKVGTGLDLNSAGSTDFTLEKLPQADFYCYLRLQHPLPLSGGLDRSIAWGGTGLTMEIKDEAGSEVFSETAPLRDWVFSGAVGSKHSDLYKMTTHFTPKPGSSYTLSVTVDPVADVAPDAQLLLMGGGWKVEGQAMPVSSFPGGR